MSQVYGIARQAGGTTCIDIRVGEGTTVRIYLRTSAPAAVEYGGDTGDFSKPVSPARILIVDDDPDLRRVLVASLEALA